MAGFECAQQCLAGEIERRANLAGFENITNTVRQPCAVPLQLILERLVEEYFFQLCDSLVAEKVLFRFLTLAFVAVGNVGVKVDLVAGLAVAVNARQSLNLPPEQVNLFEVAA